MLYSKLGSIPKTDTDGTDGWIEVDYPPNPVADGYEVIWWYPPGWVVRPIKPNATGTNYFSWDQHLGQWIEYSSNGVPLYAIALTTQHINVL